VAAIAAAAGLPLHRLELEVLETVPITDPGKARATMSRLRTMGVGLAIDDFGEGHSRDFLRMDLPVTKIKLARSIVVDEKASAALGGFVADAHALGIAVTAEGVETREQALAMQAAGCDYLQGYFFARPSPAEGAARALLEGARER
jgi:EAL domain-containing protein (putative c-di-GMP-specific phosphodiesterase class I)